MRHYELVVVLSPMINPEEVSEAWDRIKSFITDREADINFEEKWGTRRLAYPIRKGQYQFLEGNYHLTRFSTEQPFNRELENFLKVDDQVLRSMVTATLPEDELAAQAAAQARAIRTPPPRPAPVGVAAEGRPGAAVAPAAATAEAPAAEAAAEPAAETAAETAAAEPEATVTESEDAAAAVEEETPVAEVEEEPPAAVEEEPVAEVEEASADEEPAAEPVEVTEEPADEPAEEPAEEDPGDANETEE